MPATQHACQPKTSTHHTHPQKRQHPIRNTAPQIAIFAIPLAVIVGWAINRPFSLDLDPFAVVALTVGVVHANFVTAGAQSHWLMGLQLIATYLLIAVTFLYR
jgi:calcium/proton exchanger cax